jgi:hypothetical protein
MKKNLVPSILLLQRPEQLHVLINSKVKALLFEHAKKLQISVGDYINYLIANDLHESGMLVENEELKDKIK